MQNARLYFWAFLDFVLTWIAFGVHWLRGMLADAGLPPIAQTAVIIATAVMIAVVLLRVVGGTLRLLLIVLAVLLVARALGLSA